MRNSCNLCNRQRGEAMVILSQEKICTHKGCTVWLQRIQELLLMTKEEEHTVTKTVLYQLGCSILFKDR